MSDRHPFFLQCTAEECCVEGLNLKRTVFPPSFGVREAAAGCTIDSLLSASVSEHTLVSGCCLPSPLPLLLSGQLSRGLQNTKIKVWFSSTAVALLCFLIPSFGMKMLAFFKE